MDDDRVWSFEKSLWTGDADHYRELVDAECLMVLPTPPFWLQREMMRAGPWPVSGGGVGKP